MISSFSLFRAQNGPLCFAVIAPGLWESDNARFGFKARHCLSVRACNDRKYRDAYNVGCVLSHLLTFLLPCEALRSNRDAVYHDSSLKWYATCMCKGKVRNKVLENPGEINSTFKDSLHFVSGGSAGCFIGKYNECPLSFLWDLFLLLIRMLQPGSHCMFPLCAVANGLNLLIFLCIQSYN